MLKRKAYDKLLAWKESKPHNCLMIKGARQVGKTYLVREFGKNEYESFVEINFIKNSELKIIFSGDLSADNIYKQMTANIKDINLIPGKTLIFLDEIQACGNARTAIKFLTEDGRYDVISSGSLLGLSYSQEADKDVEDPMSIPVGYEDFITMYSLDFEEFLWANGYGNEAIEILKEYFESSQTVPYNLNSLYESLFREFIVVGGMPEVVQNFVVYKDYTKVSRIQERILEDYRYDIAKHAKGAEKIKARACYDAIPVQLAKEIKKFQYSTVEKGQTSKKYWGSVKWLVDSCLANRCNNVTNPLLPLMGYVKDEQFKLYTNDTGLLCAMYGFETKRAILNNTIVGNAKGGIYENVIAELLIKAGYKIYYYKPDDNHELEFVIEKFGAVCPVEVKAGNTSSVSLNNFIKDYNPPIAYKFISGGNGTVETKRTVPHYMVMFI